jgi:arylsulfatase
MDSLRADHCGFMGYYRNTTPFINKLCEKNTLIFKNCISSGTYTSESIISMFTGENSHIIPDDVGVNLSPKEWRNEIKKRNTIASHLKEMGYTTIAFTPNPLTSKLYGFDKGFDYYEDFINNSFLHFKKYYINLLGKFIEGENFVIPWQSYYNMILNSLKKVTEPFFLWIFLLDTHIPYNCPLKYRNWSTLLDSMNLLLKDGLFKKYYNQKHTIKKKINLYDDSIRYVDKFVETLIDGLRSFNPIYLINSDHGECFGEHDWYGHGEDHFYEENIHIPFIIVNSESSGEITTPFSLNDVYELFDEDFLKNGKIDINNLQSKAWAISKTYDNGNIRLGLRTKRYKFMKRKNYELYDLKTDPNENDNIIDHYPKLAKEFKIIYDSQIIKEKKIIDFKRSIANKSIGKV